MLYKYIHNTHTYMCRHMKIKKPKVHLIIKHIFDRKYFNFFVLCMSCTNVETYV